MKEMVDDHEKDVDKFKKHAENGNDSDIKAFAAKTLTCSTHAPGFSKKNPRNA